MILMWNRSYKGVSVPELEPWCDEVVGLCVGVKINLINLHDNQQQQP